jgi:putative transcriptional regulator
VNKVKKELFDELLESVREAKAIMRGQKKPSRVFVYDDPDVKTIRRRFKLSQPKFANLLGISVGTLRNWEQGRRKPEGAARVLLVVAAKYPEAILDTIHPRNQSKVIL